MEINASQIAAQRAMQPATGHFETAAAEREQPPPEEERRRQEEEALRPALTLEAERGLGAGFHAVA
ncbi:MAG: hypothetical protein HY709_05185 [Candidatus Latescibacteria bacterium]|nr:hypothetical protein [Candidatus Latescibacterota bacterium]